MRVLLEQFCQQKDDHIRKCIQKNFLDQKALELEKNISYNTNKITKSIFVLEEKVSCKRECKPGCKIFHTKHNWSKTYSLCASSTTCHPQKEKIYK